MRIRSAQNVCTYTQYLISRENTLTLLGAVAGQFVHGQSTNNAFVFAYFQGLSVLLNFYVRSDVSLLFFIFNDFDNKKVKHNPRQSSRQHSRHQNSRHPFLLKRKCLFTPFCFFNSRQNSCQSAPNSRHRFWRVLNKSTFSMFLHCFDLLLKFDTNRHGIANRCEPKLS